MDRGEIYDAELDAPGTIPGHEQTGFRPVLVISPRVYNNRSLFVVIIPFTTNLNTSRLPYTIPVNPSVTNGLSDPSILLVLQFRALANNRFRTRRFRGVIEPEILAHAMSMIQEMV
jgi:mRNA-degrading endonuclease toxin of MazEF toxin-antitoxin module